jgi:hypothetical protein
MSQRPAYFEAVREKAAARWTQLENDRELAGPWHQLFRQVQSPRHVLSELLQNADDAGATSASVRAERGVFEFEHDGADFTADEFASLCRFGYSAKRTLHTIGFRGIGFKSTFSLGDTVELATPTLSVEFRRRRFTEPVWVEAPPPSGSGTRVRVLIKDAQRKMEVERNLHEWTKTPLSLLFFRSLRRLTIGSDEVEWVSLGPGPVPDSVYMAQKGREAEPLLLLRSQEEEFPAEAVEEMRQERGVEDEEFVVPACRVELVLGAPGRLYVVLPTGVETDLPFACSAPFVQDPARDKIKPPATSATNQWLLRRLGALAGTSILKWLEDRTFGPADRAGAYDLLPARHREVVGPEGAAAEAVVDAIAESLDGADVILTADGTLAPAGSAVALPRPVAEAWGATRAAQLLDERARAALSLDVPVARLDRLRAWDFVEVMERKDIARALVAMSLPKPDTFEGLLALWAFVEPETQGYFPNADPKALGIVPVAGSNVLHPAKDVVALAATRPLESEEDWVFLQPHLPIMDPSWQAFLAAHAERAQQHRGEAHSGETQRATQLLTRTGLAVPSKAGELIDRAALHLFADGGGSLPEAVRLAQIAARLGAQSGEGFRFFTRDGSGKAPSARLYVDRDGALEDLLPPSDRPGHLLDDAYRQPPTSCTPAEWERWIDSGRAGLHTSVQLEEITRTIYGRAEITQEAARRGYQTPLDYQYKTAHFQLVDRDFSSAAWAHWHQLAASDELVWVRVVQGMLRGAVARWADLASARIVHVATNWSTKALATTGIGADWLLKLRELPCLLDTMGVPRRPDDLLRRTPETEPFLDVEPFVDARWDREAAAPLLDLLGVRSKPADARGLLRRLRALAQAPKPPVQEVEKWYRRLDQLLAIAPAETQQLVRDAFKSERLVLSEEHGWCSVDGAFLSPDEDDVPGAAMVRSAVRDLRLWRHVGVADRPTADLAIAWLKSLPTHAPLNPADLRRAKALLRRHPMRIWSECERWLNLAGEWGRQASLRYALGPQEGARLAASQLFPHIRQETADLQMLESTVASKPPFVALTRLAEHVEERVQRGADRGTSVEPKEWLPAVGEALARVELDDADGGERVRKRAAILATTRWQEAEDLETIPYLAGNPAGTARRVEVVWAEGILHVRQQPPARLARLVPAEVARVLGGPDEIRRALDYCYDRSAAAVREYMEGNFNLRPVAVAGASIAAERAVPHHDPSASDEAARDGVADVETLGGSAAGDGALAPSTDGELTPAGGADAGATAAAADGGGNGQVEPAPGPQERTPPRPHVGPPRKALIERFALAQGFNAARPDRFVRRDGATIARSSTLQSWWELRGSAGVSERFYWPKDHCLDLQPLLVDSEVWRLLELEPETHSLVLEDAAGAPIELRGARLRRMRDDGQLAVHPASYRIKHNHARAL